MFEIHDWPLDLSPHVDAVCTEVTLQVLSPQDLDAMLSALGGCEDGALPPSWRVWLEMDIERVGS
jgi:hypothetical protein